jgi:hypothetical protein
MIVLGRTVATTLRGSMTDFRILLQCTSYPIGESCTHFATEGIALPAHISIVACDRSANPVARTLHAELETRLGRMGVAGTTCSAMFGSACAPWTEPSCQHVLVLVISSPLLDASYDDIARDWLRSTRGRGIVISALDSSLIFADVVDELTHPTLSRCAAPTWGRDTGRLAELVLSASLLDERPGVFVSYLRKEALGGADQIHDALTHAGYRVFLDRFNGTPGRVFPRELAESMASMGLVLVLETAGLRGSDWTMFEVNFAHRYRLGPIAVNFGLAPRTGVATERLLVADDPLHDLPPQEVERIVDFVQTHALEIALSRRAYFETLVRLAASAAGSSEVDAGFGVMSLQRSGVPYASVLPAAVPGRLRHVHRLASAATRGRAILAGEHQHLPLADSDDLRWLARERSVTLAGSGSVFRVVRSL